MLSNSPAASLGLLLLVFGALGCGKSATPPTNPSESADNGVAATVNGETINLVDFYQRMGLKDNAQVITPRGPTQVRLIGNFGLQSLQEQVDQAVLLQLAKEQGVLPTDDEVETEVKLQSQIRTGYVELLESQGWTLPMIKRDLMIGLAREKLISKGVVVSPDDIDKFIKSNPGKFMEPARANLFFIQVSSIPLKAEVDRKLASKIPFDEVVRQNGEQPYARETGGKYETDILSQMPKKIQAIVGDLAPRQTSGWIQDGVNYLKYYVESKSPAKAMSITGTQREMVRRELAMDEGQKKNDFTKLFYDKLKSSSVVVSIPYLKDEWGRTWAQMTAPPSIAAPKKPGTAANKRGPGSRD